MNAAILLIASATCGQFTVVNKMPSAAPAFKVVNKCQPCALCDGNCRCKTCDCAVLEAMLAKPMATRLTGSVAPPVVAKKTTTQTVVTTRAAYGHTHTCARCGTTWDHAANPGHTCRFCGTSQYAVDRVSRPVTVRRQVVVDATPAKTVPAQTITLQTLQTSAAFSSACANGNCATVSAPRGFFRWR